MSIELIGLIVAFIGGVLVDHFLFNKLAGLVSGEVAQVKANLAAVEAKMASEIDALWAKLPGSPILPVPPVVPPVPVVTDPKTDPDKPF